MSNEGAESKETPKTSEDHDQGSLPNTSVSSSISSGYVSEQERMFVTESQQHRHQNFVTPYQFIPASLNPLLVQHPNISGNSSRGDGGGGLTNDQPFPFHHHHQQQYLFPGQTYGHVLPYTAPLMMATNEQMMAAQHAGFPQQQPPHATEGVVSHHNVEHRRQYSGPVLSTSFGNAVQNPIPTSHQVNNAVYMQAGSQQQQYSNAHMSTNVLSNETQPRQAEQQVSSSFISNAAAVLPVMSRPASMVTQSLGGFGEERRTEEDIKTPRRNTLPKVDGLKSKREMFKKPVYSMKEKSLQEEEEYAPSFSIGEDFGGYDYQFLVSTEELQEMTCPICQLVLCEPFLTTCCGSHFCKECVAHLHAKKNPQCPMCNNDGLQGIIDRRTERKINSLPVRCTKSSLGCTWTGSLTDMHNHLNTSTGDCQYVIVPCSFGCGEEHSLAQMKYHQEETCPRRIHQCKFCNYKGVYEDMPKRHWPICEGYPVPCPYNCSANDMPRRLLSKHLEECPKRSVVCCFSYAGCSVPLQGDEMQQHMNENVGTHLNLVSEMVKQLLSNWEEQQKAPPHINSKNDTERNTEIIILNRKLNEKEEEITTLKGQLTTIQEDNEEMKQDMARMKSKLYTPPFEFRVKKFAKWKSGGKQWFSMPFYTHSQGYKMCISVDCNGADEGEGTYVSVYANLMQGEFDENLFWPFVGVITVRLFNQCSDENHITHDIPFCRDESENITGRVMNQELADSGLGVPQFVSHTQLGYNRIANTEYLKDDCLKFSVIQVKLHH